MTGATANGDGQERKVFEAKFGSMLDYRPWAGMLDSNWMYECTRTEYAWRGFLAGIEHSAIAKMDVCEPMKRVVVLELNGERYTLPACDLDLVLAEIQDTAAAGEVSYKVTFTNIPRAEFEALGEFNGF